MEIGFRSLWRKTNSGLTIESMSITFHGALPKRGTAGKFVSRFALFAVAMLILTTSWGCSGTNTSGVVQQGIRGTATLKILPGIPNVPPSISPLADAVIAVQPAGGGAEIKRQKANAIGQFEITLPVGTYLIVPLEPEPNQAPITSLAPQQTVVVRAGGFTVVNLEYLSAAP